MAPNSWDWAILKCLGNKVSYKKLPKIFETLRQF